MKTAKKFYSIFFIVFAGIGLISLLTFRSRKDEMLKKIADEGYETAMDVLYPGKESTVRKLHYGPVIPA